MKLSSVTLNGQPYKRLITFGVQTDVQFNIERLTSRLRRQIAESFPNHERGVSVERGKDQLLNFLCITFPDQTIEGLRLTESELLRVLTDLESKTVAALEHAALLEMAQP